MDDLKTNESFSSQDLRIVKKDLMGNILPSITVFLFLFLILFIYFSVIGNFGFTFYSSLVLSIFLSISVFFILTYKHWRDLKYQKVVYTSGIIEEMVHKFDYEVGSVTVPVNFYSLLFFKKIFMREMRKIEIFYISVNNVNFVLLEEDFNKFKKGDEILSRWSENAKVFLGFKKDNKIIQLSPLQADRVIYI